MPRWLTLPTFLLVSAASLQAQVLRGRLLSQVQGGGAGAIVALIDSSGKEAGRTVSGPTGSYGLVAPRAGGFRVRVWRVGYPVWTSEPVAIRAGEVVQFSPELPVVGLVIAPLTVTATNSCSIRPTEREPTAQLLEEGRKAVASAGLLMQGADYRFVVRRYVKKLGKDLIPYYLDSIPPIASNVWPVQSLPVAQLAAGGFVQPSTEDDRLIYYGPDPQVIFSDFFLDHHCFRVRAPSAKDSGQVQLEFQVVPGRKLADIEGALWIDPKTFDLSHLDFDYTRLPSWAPPGSARGRLDFLRLPNGLWIIRRWAVRVPIAQRSVLNGIYSVFGYQEEGGEVVEVRGRDGGEVFEKK